MHFAHSVQCENACEIRNQMSSEQHLKSQNTASNAGENDANDDAKNAAKSDKNKATKKDISSGKVIKRRLRVELRKEMLPLAVGSVAMLASSLSNQALVRLMGRLIDSQKSTTPKSDHLSIRSSLGLVVLGGGLASFVRTVQLQRAESSIATSLRKQAFESLLITKDLEWFQSESVYDGREDEAIEKNGQNQQEGSPPRGVSPGAVSAILNEDAKKVSSCVTSTTANMFRAFSSVIFGTINMLRLDPALFGASVAVVPAIGAAAMILRKGIKRLTAQQGDLALSTSTFVEERLTHIDMVKLSNRQRDEVNAFCEMQDKAACLSRRTALRQGLFMGFMFGASSGALLLVVNLGGRSVKTGKMTGGQLTSFATYSFMLGLGTSSIVKNWSEFLQGMVSAERLYRLIGEKRDNSDPSQQQMYQGKRSSVLVETEASNGNNEIDGQHVSAMKVKNVCFRYKSTGVEVLKNISFEWKHGTVLALVGENGSGKSSLASILAGLYSPESGKIELQSHSGNNTDIATLGNANRKNLIQVIPQSTALFNTSILENVRYCNPEASEQAVLAALKLANCEGFVSKLKGGIHFQVGLNGSKLSGGERQRLALARSMVCDPAFLIMDEAASALDTEGELAIQDAVQECRRSAGRGLLLISHNPNTLDLADLVLVMKEGRIVEAGKLQDLRGIGNSELNKLMPLCD